MQPLPAEEVRSRSTGTSVPRELRKSSIAAATWVPMSKQRPVEERRPLKHQSA
ncbi:hypothetical protein HMPREF9004_1007 [Schaalia cardiffensis F0333]|uniref:Uncharacterized protein n=1 Tax=Schaalia cardiffensis F0333 TaxID=888050 RepID=N6XB76_9ACTO|nr:hypothetical protein HMPREF9004_1007 [Schaalia cardiffensis F0333]